MARLGRKIGKWIEVYITVRYLKTAWDEVYKDRLKEVIKDDEILEEFVDEVEELLDLVKGKKRRK